MKKLTKAQARKAFDRGEVIYLHTNKMRLNSMWQSPMEVKKDFEQEMSRKEMYNWKESNGYNNFRDSKNTLQKEAFIEEFDLVVNEYSYYNCDKERGNIVTYWSK